MLKGTRVTRPRPSRTTGRMQSRLDDKLNEKQKDMLKE